MFSYDGVVKSDRLREMMKQRGLSQSELARRVGVAQATIYKLVSGTIYSTKHLHKIARELGTTPAYLSGEIDDALEGALPPVRTVHFVTMQVALPPEPALARMFEGLLRMMPADAPLDERAQLLARRLPIGLSQLRDLLPVGPETAVLATDPVEAPPTPDPARKS